MPDLAESIGRAYAALAIRGVVLSTDLMSRLRRLGIKTYGYFGGVIDRLVRSLYNHQIDELEFTMIFEDLLDGQLRQAWLEGMGQNDLTEDDMTQEFETQLGAILLAEHEAISGFAEAILEQEGQDHLSGENHLEALLTRADLWQNRYQDVVNQAAIYTAGRADYYVWVFGQTEQHCETCAALNEVVATAEDWEASGYHPQRPPNDLLECGGWLCDCRLEKTEAEPTQKGPPRV